MDNRDVLKTIFALADKAVKMDGVTLEKYIVNTYKPFFVEKAVKGINSDLIRLNIIINHQISKKPMLDISENDIELFFSYLEKRRGVSRATVNRYRSRLNAIFNHAVRDKVILDNPVKYIKKYKEAPRDRVLSVPEAVRLLEACRESRNKELYTIVAIALNSGLRRGEILRLKRDDISDGRIILRAGATKSGYARIVPCNEHLNKILSEYLEELRADRDELFTTRCVKVSFGNALKRAGIEKFRFHDLRRTFATSLKNANVNLYEVSKLLGHCNTTMTERYLTSAYNNLLDSVQKIGFS